ncbi:MAG: glycosyltransferase family 39 protein [Candidatus Pacebacteria bacterium]|nr:glycosyltransferase family 39 protein [Candidatus Paceibacterota bacterium]
MDKHKKILIIFLAIVFAVNIAYSFYFKIPPAVDARAYENIAWNIVQGNGYRESLDVPLNNDNAIIRVGPGYEFFIAGIYSVFGRHYEVVWVIQALLVVLSALMIFLITREIFKTQWSFGAGIAAAALIGLSPDIITLQGMLMTETLGVFSVILAVYVFFRYINYGQRLWLAGLAGICLGLAVLVRTPAAFLFFPMAAYLLFHKKWKDFLIMGFMVFLVLLPWTIRNYNIFHAFIPTNEATGFNLLAGNHSGATGEQDPYPALEQYVQELGYVGANNRATKEALNFVAGSPLEFIKLTAYRASIYFSFARPTGFWFHLNGLSKALTLVFSSIYSVFLFVLGFWGIWKIKDLIDKKNAKLLLWMLIMMPLAVVGIIVETRYRFLIYPFLAIFAGYGFQELINKRLRLGPALYIAGILFLNAGFDILRNLGRIMERIKGL